MIPMIIEIEFFLHHLMKRVNQYTSNKVKQELFYRMYSNRIKNGEFDNQEFIPNYYVDNDYNNWCQIVNRIPKKKAGDTYIDKGIEYLVESTYEDKMLVRTLTTV